ncbi:MAG TPA: hypothetical protein VGF38_08170 [Ktedonobacterales bacterium]|jgi:hypothetical protein
MSNVGTGGAAVGVGALAIVPLVAIGLVVGAGVLCYKGIMYCGNQLDKQYAERNSAIAAQKAAEMRAQLARVDTTQQYFRTEVRRMAAHAARLDLVAPPPEMVTEAAASTRTFISGQRPRAETLAEAQSSYLRDKLASEIRVGTGKLPDDLMARATNALTAPSSDIQIILDEIDAAWKRAAAERNDQQYERPKLDLRLRELRAWFAGLRDSIARQPEIDRTAYDTRLQRIGKQIDEAERLPIATAMGKLAPIEDELDAVTDDIALDVRAARDRVVIAVSPIAAQIENLTAILKDVGNEASGLLTAAQIAPLSDALDALKTRAEQIEATGTMREIDDLATAVADQERKIIDPIKKTQQRQLASIIQATLAEQGFAQDPMAKPRPGDTLAVVGARQQLTQEGAADQRRVTFEVSPDCAISYDFSGYVGESCLVDAERIFTALAQKGIYIVSDEDMAKLRERAESTSNLLRDAGDMVVKPVMNKRQAVLASRILEVLQGMGYQIINRETIGDTVYFDASHDGLGFFSVAVDGEGDARIFTDRDHTQRITAYSDDDLVKRLASAGSQQERGEEPSPVWQPDREQQVE